MSTILDPTSAFAPPTGLATTALIREKIVNHVVLILDASPSMSPHVKAVREQIKALIGDLAEQSTTMDQETRLSIYAFSTEVQCLAFDTDVLRLRDVHERYSILRGYTALMDATAIGLDDLASTSTLYGDHGFLAYVLTDGGENDSRRYDRADIAARMRNLPDNWTVAALVPDVRGRTFARDVMGFPGDNVAIWDASSREGFAAAATVIRSATAGYMTGRESGVRGTRTLFSTGSDAVNESTVKANLVPLPRDSYVLMPVSPVTGSTEQLKPFVQRNGLTFVTGRHYYELTKTERIQASKKVIVVNRNTGEAYGGDQGRAIIGLPIGIEAKVTPDYNPEWAVFVQSAASAGNRNLIRGQRLLTVLK